MTRPRSIFMRKDFLLTTLAAAVLLAASAGTAWAQSPRIGFTPRSGSVNEGATADADSEHPLLTVTVRARGLPAGPAGEGADGQPTPRQQAIDALGEITIETEGIGRREAATISPLYDTPAALDEDVVFAASDTFQLTVDPVQDDDSLNDEFSLRLRSTESINTGARYRGTVIDDDPLATATFSRTDIKVFEGSEAQPQRPRCRPGGRELSHAGGDQNIVLTATPRGAVDVAECRRRANPTLPCASGRRPRRCRSIGCEAGSPSTRASPTISGGRRTCGSPRAATCRIPGFHCHAGVPGILAADARRQNRRRSARNYSDPQ